MAADIIFSKRRVMKRVIYMKFNSIKSFLLKSPSGTIWHFYLSHENRILYTSMDEKPLEQPLALNLQHIKDFEATIDPDGIVHLLVLTQVHQLIYYRWDGVKWQHQMVEHNRYRVQYIPYFAVLASRKHIHIVYCIKGQSRRSSEIIMHYVGKNNEWNGGRVWVFTSERITRLHSTFADCDDRIHLLFSQKKDDEYLLRYSQFNPESLNWSDPANIYSSGYHYPDCNLYVHQDGHIHIIWKEQDKDGYSIMYLSMSDSPAPPGEFKSTKVLYKGEIEPVHPILFFEEKLYCLWEMKGSIYYILSMDMGKNWSDIMMLPDSVSGSPTFYSFTAFDIPGTPPTVKLWSTDYERFPDNIKVHQTAGKTDAKYIFRTKNTSHFADKEQLENIQKNLNRLEKRLKTVERQLENIIPAVYVLQDQFRQTNKSKYYIEATIKKLNFQMEQLINRSSRYTSVNKAKHETIVTSPDEQTPSDDAQSHKLQDTHPAQPDESGTREKTSHALQDRSEQHSQTISDQYPQATPEQPPQSIAPETKTQQTDGLNNAQSRSAAAWQNNGDTNRISLGNVDILINPEDDDL